MEIKPGSVFHSHFFKDVYDLNWGFPDGSVGEGNGNPLQFSCLENPMDEEAW